MKRCFLFIISVLIIITMLPSSALSESRVTQNKDINKVLSADEVVFLENYKISSKEIAMLKRDEAQRVISQAKIYNLSEIQVKSLVNIELYGNSLDVTKDKEAIGNRLDAKTVIPDRYAGIKHQLTEADVKKQLSLQFANDEQYIYDEDANPNDQTGVYWLVQGNTGYDQVTTFVDLPELETINSCDVPYMFVAANSFTQGNSLTFIGDYGLVYMAQYGAWYPFINASQWNDPLPGEESGHYVNIENDVYLDYPIPTGVDKFYFHLYLVNGDVTDEVHFRCLYQDTFSTIFVKDGMAIDELVVTFNGNPVQNNETNMNLYRQTTMAQHKPDLDGDGNEDVDLPLVTNTGSWMKNAKFSNAHLYDTGVATDLWDEDATQYVAIKAPTEAQLNTVELISADEWYNDEVSIRFNVP